MAGRPKATELKEKHWKALELLEHSDLTLKQIAAECGIPTETMYDLHIGNSSRAGAVADIFAAEVRKIEKKMVAETQKLSRNNARLAHELLERALISLKTKKKLTAAETKLVTTINNSIAKSMPKVSIGSLTYNYTKGLSAEELVHEFTRLRTVATGASQRGAVQTALAGGPGVLPSPAERGGELAEKPESP